MTNDYGLDSVNVSFLSGNGASKGGKSSPLVITPRWDSSKAFLVEWSRANRSWLDEKVLEYGAVLVRGFDLDTSLDMQHAIQAYHPHLDNTYRGTSPRKLMDNTEYVFSAAEVPSNYPIAQHIEMSFLDAPPRQLYFGCVKPSASAGGETAIADFRRVYDELSDELKQKFLDKGIRYERTHKKKGTYFTYDVADMLGWPEMFGTDSKEEVEELCTKEGMPFKWEGDTFVSAFQSDAFQLHPVTKEPVWFNHTQVFHWTAFPAELWFAFKRTHNLLLLFHCILVTVFCVIKYGILGHKMSLHCTFGDGTPISIKEMSEIRHAIHKNIVFSRWAKGDLMYLDNFGVSHGRQPTYDRSRKIVVAWSDPFRKTNEVKSLEDGKNAIPFISAENPQERTPESTLNQNESQKLKQHMLSRESLTNSLKALVNDNPQGLEKRPSAVDMSFWKELED